MPGASSLCPLEVHGGGGGWGLGKLGAILWLSPGNIYGPLEDWEGRWRLQLPDWQEAPPPSVSPHPLTAGGWMEAGMSEKESGGALACAPGPRACFTDGKLRQS